MALSLDEDRLDDEVFPGNETDEACLQEMIELYMMRSDLDHSWEKIQAVLENIESSSELYMYTYIGHDVFIIMPSMF